MKNKKLKSLPVTWRVNLWYTIFIALLLSLLLLGLYGGYRYFSHNLASRHLVSQVEEVAADFDDLDDLDDFEGYHDTIFLTIYS